MYSASLAPPPSPFKSPLVWFSIGTVLIFCIALYISLYIDREFVALWGSREANLPLGSFIASLLVFLTAFGFVVASAFVAFVPSPSSSSSSSTPRPLRRRRLGVSFALGVASCIASYLLFLLFQGFVYGERGQSHTCDATIDYAIMTVMRNAAHAKATHARLEMIGIDAEIMYGLDARDFDSSLAVLAGVADGVTTKTMMTTTTLETLPTSVLGRKYFAMTLDLYRVMIEISSQSLKSSDWIVILEDDAVPRPYFQKMVMAAACGSDVDVVVMDTRTSPSWYLFRRLDGGAAGVMYRRSSLTRIAETFNFEGEVWRRARRQHNIESNSANCYDELLAGECNAGHLKCGFVPAVVQSSDDNRE